jgi:hypothetical protein
MCTTEPLTAQTMQRLVAEFCEPTSAEPDTMWWILERADGRPPIRLAIQLGHDDALLGLLFDPDMPADDATVTFIIRRSTDLDAIVRNIRLAAGDLKE